MNIPTFFRFLAFFFFFFPRSTPGCALFTESDIPPFQSLFYLEVFPFPFNYGTEEMSVPHMMIFFFSAPKISVFFLSFL